MAVKAISPAAGRARPVGNFELFSWYFMRLSGIALVVLVLGHLAVMHVIGRVSDVNATFVANRMLSPLWRTWDLTMVLLALLHGVNGARWIIDDYVHSAGARLWALSALYLVAFVFVVLGSLILLTFQPKVLREGAPAGTGMVRHTSPAQVPVSWTAGGRAGGHGG